MGIIISYEKITVTVFIAAFNKQDLPLTNRNIVVKGGFAVNSDNAKSIITVEIRSDRDTPLLDLLKSLLREAAQADGGAKP